MAKKNRALHPDEPLRHSNHKRPVTRRDFIAQGFMNGAATVAGVSLFSLFADPRKAAAAVPLSSDLAALRDACGIAAQGAQKIPFICIDLAGGANISGSNVLVGGPGGQEDFLTTAGYSKLGVPGNMIPPLPDADSPDGGDHINDEFGLKFHSRSAFLKGIKSKVVDAAGRINGAVIPARSDNDTGNNPHNPMYGIGKAGADGQILTLIGSRSSDSGGNSMAPANLINPEIRPTKVDRPSDVTGLVDIGDFGSLSQAEAVRVMEAVQRISEKKFGRVLPDPADAELRNKILNCGYVKSANLAAEFGDPTSLDPDGDPEIVGAGGIFTRQEFDSEREFRKAASIMKLVINGFAGAGTITMGGYDYHTGDRRTGEIRDERAGKVIGACLEYAAKRGVPLMLYVFSDGSVASNGTIDTSEDGGDKGVWTGDNSSTAASFFMVYNPTRQPQLMDVNGDVFRHQQLGFMRPDASVETTATPAANNVNLLVNTVLLNYMALHGQIGDFVGTFGANNGLGSNLERLVAFTPIVDRLITNPV